MLLDKEVKRAGLSPGDYRQWAEQFNVKSGDDLLAGIGSGDIKLAQVIHAMQQRTEQQRSSQAEPTTTPVTPSQRPPTMPVSGFKIKGIHDLLSHTAGCCKPIPGDPIIGYITQGRGISIHRQDCKNISHSLNKEPGRLTEVEWDIGLKGRYPVDISLTAYNKQGLMRDITTLVTQQKLDLQGLNSVTDKDKNIVHVILTVELGGQQSLDKLLDGLNQISNVLNVTRVH